MDYIKTPKVKPVIIPDYTDADDTKEVKQGAFIAAFVLLPIIIWTTEQVMKGIAP